MNKTFLIFLSVAIFYHKSHADSCPVPPTDLDVTINESHEFDKKSSTYIYTYKVSNGIKAKTDLFLIDIEVPAKVTERLLPKKWGATMSDGGDIHSKTFTLDSSFNEIKPGKGGYVFKFASNLPPGITRYYLIGTYTGDGPADNPDNELKAVTLNGDDEAAPTCPGFYTEESSLGARVTGYTIGPIPPDQIDVKLKLKVKKTHSKKDKKKEDDDDDDESDVPEVLALDKGKLEVILFDAPKLDLSKVDLATIQFGPAKAKPLSTKIISKPEHVRHWRRPPSYSKDKMLLMEFNLADLQIRCDLDKALFLRAKAGTKNIVGAAQIKSGICDKKTWKQMGIERKWPQKMDEE